MHVINFRLLHASCFLRLPTIDLIPNRLKCEIEEGHTGRKRQRHPVIIFEDDARLLSDHLSKFKLADIDKRFLGIKFALPIFHTVHKPFLELMLLVKRSDRRRNRKSQEHDRCCNRCCRSCRCKPHNTGNKTNTSHSGFGSKVVVPFLIFSTQFRAALWRSSNKLVCLVCLVSCKRDGGCISHNTEDIQRSCDFADGRELLNSFCRIAPFACNLCKFRPIFCVFDVTEHPHCIITAGSFCFHKYGCKNLTMLCRHATQVRYMLDHGTRCSYRIVSNSTIRTNNTKCARRQRRCIRNNIRLECSRSIRPRNLRTTSTRCNIGKISSTPPRIRFRPWC